ncbi:NAD(P)H-dependent oxidoreductase [Rhizobium sullae]|uniref:Putative homoserine dehydrogenase-like protein n=1 Tax=Rhizobium sullae TaxID=50338 RepID=A0A4R3QNV6_RHISU|nr:flagellar biosynthesis protein FlgA [Rhizobium sullae]TCU20036.1 putative homoserine dehydrogenase-like protein [Rhizobium sullae]
MNYHSYFPKSSASVECCIVGTGAFGRSFLDQSRRTPLISARVAVDLSAETAVAALRSIGVPAGEIVLCRTEEEAAAAWAEHRFVATDNLEIVLALPFTVVVEATGHPEAGARHARLAIDAGKHVALVSKEVDSVVGPGLVARARRNNVLVTPVDGDQPSLLMGLISWAQVLGLDIIAAGKSSEYDFVFDPAKNILTSNGTSIYAPEFAAWLELGALAAPDVAAGRAQAAAALPQRTVPDLCELTLVANATGFTVDRLDLHAPIARIGEVPDFFAPVEEGGLLAHKAILDVFHCLRLPSEVSFAGGVFVTVECNDAATWAMLAEKGHVVSRSGRTAMLYLPRHLLGVEAASSVLEVGLKGVSSGAEEPKPVIDLIAHADADLPAGTLLAASGHHHSITNVSGRMVPAQAISGESPVPFYLAANRRLVRPVSAGSPILCADVEIDDSSELLSLRQEQDRIFSTTSR